MKRLYNYFKEMYSLDLNISPDEAAASSWFDLIFILFFATFECLLVWIATMVLIINSIDDRAFYWGMALLFPLSLVLLLIYPVLILQVRKKYLLQKRGLGR